MTVLVFVLLLLVGLLTWALTRQLQLDITYQNHNLYCHELNIVCNFLGGLLRWSKKLTLPLSDILAPDVQTDSFADRRQGKKSAENKEQSPLLRFWLCKDCRQYFLSHINLQKIDLQLCLGCNDAAVTACLTGLAYVWQGALAAYLCQNCQSNCCQLQMNVRPDFYDQRLELNYRCIFAVRAVHIIIVANKLRQLKV